MGKSKQQNTKTNRLYPNQPKIPQQHKKRTNNRRAASQYATRQTAQSNTYANMPKTGKQLQKTPNPETGARITYNIQDLICIRGN